MATFVVLLRAIGPVTHKIMSMAQWRDAVATAGYADPQTYVATGNMIIGSDKGIGDVTRDMNAVVLGLGLGKGNVAIVREAGALNRLLNANPFPAAAAERPSELTAYFFAGTPDFGWMAGYEGPEPWHIEGQHLFVDYAGRAEPAAGGHYREARGNGDSTELEYGAGASGKGSSTALAPMP